MNITLEKSGIDIFSLINQSVIYTNLNGVIEKVNSAIVDLTGYKNDEFKDKYFYEFIKFSENITIYDILNEFEVDNNKVEINGKIKRKNLIFNDCKIIVIPNKDLENNITGFIFFISDNSDIVYLKKIIAEREIKLRSQYANFPVAAVSFQYFDEALILTDFNKAMESFTDGNINNFRGEDAKVIFSKREKIVKDLYTCLKEKKSFQRETNYKMLTTGEDKYLSIKYTYIERDTIIVFVEDITKQKVLQDKLFKSKTIYRAIINDQTDFICRWNLNEGLKFINKAYSNYFEIKSENLEHYDFTDFILKEDKNSFLEMINKINEQNPVMMFENRVKLNEEIRWHQWTHRGIFNKKNEVIEYQSVGRDITDRKIVEMRLYEKTNEMEKIFEVFPDVFFLINKNYKVIDFLGNYNVLKIKSFDAIERSLSDIFSEAIFDKLKEKLDIVLKNKINEHCEYWMEIDGNEKCFETRFIPIFNDKVIMITRDITEKKKAENELKTAKETLEQRVNERTATLSKINSRLEKEIAERIQAEEESRLLHEQFVQAQKMEALGVLAGGIAHDFNNLMNVINGYSQMLMWNIEKNGSLYEDLQEIQKAAMQAARLTSQLLVFSRQEQSEKKLINLNSEINEITKMINRIIGEDIEINIELAEDLAVINADQGNIEQIIMNLVINARDAMPNGGTIIIKTFNEYIDVDYSKITRYSKPGHFVCLEIQDTGSGMDRITVDRIFEPFFTTKGPSKGTGLGLSVVYGIVKNHGGWIEVNSEIGTGTKFSIYLPAVKKEINTDKQLDNIKEKCHGNGEKILLIEDEKALLKINSRALEENGYKVYSCSTGIEARKIFDELKGSFDLIFSDVVLPDISGLTLTDEFLKKKDNVKILLSSGYTNEKSRINEIKSKNIRFLQKPYKLIDLFKMVKEIIAN